MRIYFFSPVPWEFLRQRSQHLADQFRAHGVPVTFIESTSIRGVLAKGVGYFLSQVLRSLWWHVRALFFSRNGAAPIPSARVAERPVFEVMTPPVVLPLNRFNSPALARLNARVYRCFLRHTVLRRKPAGEVAVAFIEQLPWAPAIRPGDFDRLYVDFLDDVSVYAGKSSPERFVGFLRHLAPMTEAAFVTAEKLEPMLRSYGYACPLHRVPNGVDYEWFLRHAAARPVPPDLAATHRPRAGYVGAVYRWIDFDLITRTARATPDITFVFIGPFDDAINVDRLRGAPNVIWLPAKPYADMPVCIREFDVCLIPFAAGEVAETTNPVKLFEYFALGKPVIATPMAELTKYAGLLHTVRGPEEFGRALRDALSEADPAVIDARQAVARAHSWQAHASAMLDVMKAG